MKNYIIIQTGIIFFTNSWKIRIFYYNNPKIPKIPNISKIEKCYLHKADILTRIKLTKQDLY